MSRVRIYHHPRSLASCLVVLLLISALTQFYIVPMADAKKENTHYDVLELKQDASLKDIKKAYRRLAVQHHPDRNRGNEEEATIKFREISEAYEILSDEDSRREYDRSLRGGASFGTGSSDWDRQRRHHRRPHRDPFDQFNDLFQNDPFFKEAFKSMDDLFDRHFSNTGDSNFGSRKSTGGSTQQRDTNTKVDTNEGGGAGGWIWNKVKDYMPNVNVQIKTSSSSSRGGSTSYSSTSRSYGSSRSSSSSYSSSSSRGGSSSSYTSRSTRTVVQNGQRVTIQSLEKDGNKIEEKYIGEKLIERKINGMKEDLGMIDEF